MQFRFLYEKYFGDPRLNCCNKWQHTSGSLIPEQKNVWFEMKWNIYCTNHIIYCMLCIKDLTIDESVKATEISILKFCQKLRNFTKKFLYFSFDTEFRFSLDTIAILMRWPEKVLKLYGVSHIYATIKLAKNLTFKRINNGKRGISKMAT